jgi:hypothetical protein
MRALAEPRQIMFRRSAIALSLLGALVSSTTAVVAAPAYDPEEEALIRRGIELRKALDDEAARAAFQKAYDLTHSPRAAAQLGLAEFALGRWEDADAHVGEAMRAPKDPFIAKHRGQLEGSLVTIKSHLARVDVVGEPVGAEVFVNGRAAGQLPLSGPITVSAGQVDVELRAPGFKRASRTVALLAGQYQRMVMRLERPSSAPGGDSGARAESGGGTVTRPTTGSDNARSSPATDADPAQGPEPTGDRAHSAHTVAKWTALGLAGAGLATGIASSLVYRNGVQTFQGLHNGGCYDSGGLAVDADGNRVPDCQPSLNTYRAARTWQIIGFASAGAFAATWLILMLTEPEPGDTPPSSSGNTAATGSAMHWACAPSLLGGFSCAARF